MKRKNQSVDREFDERNGGHWLPDNRLNLGKVPWAPRLGNGSWLRAGGQPERWDLDSSRRFCSNARKPKERAWAVPDSAVRPHHWRDCTLSYAGPVKNRFRCRYCVRLEWKTLRSGWWTSAWDVMHSRGTSLEVETRYITDTPSVH